MNFKNEKFEFNTTPEDLIHNENKIKELYKEQIQIKRGIPILCYGCKRFERLSEYKYAMLEHYVSPRGCTDGDYWTTSGIEIICPHCGKTDRIFIGYSEDDRKAFYEIVNFFSNVAQKQDNIQV